MNMISAFCFYQKMILQIKYKNKKIKQLKMTFHYYFNIGGLFYVMV